MAEEELQRERDVLEARHLALRERERLQEEAEQQEAKKKKERKEREKAKQDRRDSHRVKHQTENKLMLKRMEALEAALLHSPPRDSEGSRGRI